MISEQVRQDYPAAAALEQHSGSWITDAVVHAGQLTLMVEPGAVLDICRFLKDSRGYRLSGISGVDWHPVEPRFEVVHLLHSIERKERLRLKCRLHGENASVPSVTSVWEGASWYERETFDLFGITFTGHPNLTRIMMPDYWDGHPLRKDFPVHGHRYSYSEEGNPVL
ncbi:MAG TPA: NADH-quinone oxidoreductase subunit C [Bryobacteraceae bacterium]|nr:NADH-quinone oxidoreductase subunit C [Bryobacteraceae bacterium]